MQSQMKDEMFIILEQYHQILKNENMKAAPDKSHFFLTRVKFLGHIIERNTITPSKSRIPAIQKLQPPTNKKKIQEFLGMLNFPSKYVYKMQLYLSSLYNILRLRFGGPRGFHAAGRLYKHLRARQPRGPPHGSFIDGRLWTAGITRPPKDEGNEVEKRGSLRK